MATTLLRKLSRKSQLKFGSMADMTVQMALDLGLKERAKLVWYYYNSSNITYMDDILDELKITENLRIKKPSKEPYLFRVWKGKSLTDNERMGLANANEKRKKEIRTFGNRLSSPRFSKDGLRKRNHGH
jgi:hypothetical protein